MPTVYINNNDTPVDATGKVLIVYQDTGYEDVIDIHDELFHPLCAYDYAPSATFKSKPDGRRVELKCWLTEDCPCEFCDAPRPWYIGCC